MNVETKRQNFNITPEQDAELHWLREKIGASSVKDVILRAIRLMVVILRELEHGGGLYLRSEAGQLTRVLLPEMEPVHEEAWRYLVTRPHSWRRQLHVKGRRLLASTVWYDMLVNGMTADEAAENWELPTSAIEEIVRYCQNNETLIKMEAEEERLRLEAMEGKEVFNTPRHSRQ